MRRKYRGFTGQVAPLAGLGRYDVEAMRGDIRGRHDVSPISGGTLGWLPKVHATAEQNERFPDSLYFCGREDYSDYVAQHGAPPAGSSILGTGMGMPQMCIDAGYRKEYVYTTGGNILQTKITGPTAPAPAPIPAPAPAPAPAKISPPAWLTEPPPTAPIEPAPVIEPRPLAVPPIAQEFEARQYPEGGDGYAPALEREAAEQAAIDAAVSAEPELRILNGRRPTAVRMPGAEPTVQPPPDAEFPEQKAPNWLPLIIAAVTIYLMQ